MPRSKRIKWPVAKQSTPKPGVSLGEFGEEGGSSIDIFISKIEGSNAQDKSEAAEKDAPKRNNKEDAAEMKETGDNLLDQLEASMDRSMQELDARYNEEFSRLERMTDEGSSGKSDARAAQADEMETKLKECGAAIEILRARLDKSEGEVGTQCAAEIEALQNKFRHAKQQVNGMRESGDEGWALVKEGLYHVIRDLTGAVKAAVARLRETRGSRH